MVFVIGLTGGICSGKTTITKYLSEQDVIQPLYVINADLVGHQTYRINTPAYQQLIATFGEDNILNSDTKEIDRAKLGNIVFKDSTEMKKLTDIVWPEIRRLIENQLREYESQELRENTKIIIILEAAVLFEAHWSDLCQSIWFITAKPEDVILRLQQRNPQLTIEQAQQRIQSQMKHMEEKQNQSSYILENNQDMNLSDLQNVVRERLVQDTKDYRSH